MGCRDGFPFFPNFLVEPIGESGIVEMVIRFGQSDRICLNCSCLLSDPGGLYVVVRWVYSVYIIQYKAEGVIDFVTYWITMRFVVFQNVGCVYVFYFCLGPSLWLLGRRWFFDGCIDAVGWRCAWSCRLGGVIWVGNYFVGVRINYYFWVM